MVRTAMAQKYEDYSLLGNYSDNSNRGQPSRLARGRTLMIFVKRS